MGRRGEIRDLKLKELQGRHTLSTSLHTRRSSMRWVGIKLVFITLLLLVWLSVPLLGTAANNYTATSGACATIASDALMNPFDGKDIIAVHLRSSMLMFSSDKTTNANAQFRQDIQIDV